MKQWDDGIMNGVIELATMSESMLDTRILERARSLAQELASIDGGHMEQILHRRFDAEENAFEMAAIQGLLNQLINGAGERLVLREGLGTSTTGEFVGRSAVLLPGTVFSVALEEAWLAMISGVPTVLLPSRRLEVEVVGLVTGLRRILPQYASQLWVCEASARAEFLKSPILEHIRVYGADDTVSYIRELAAPDTVIQSYGDMRSAAIVCFSASNDDAMIVRDVERVLADYWTWKGLGCFSPTRIYVTGSEEQVGVFCTELAERLDAMAGGSVFGLAGPAQERIAALSIMQGANVYRGAVPVVLRTLNQSTNVLPDGAIEIMHRAGFSEIVEELVRRTPMLSTIGLSDGCITSIRATRDLEAYCHRLVPVGDMQRPNFERLHDGQPRLRALLREESESIK